MDKLVAWTADDLGIIFINPRFACDTALDQPDESDNEDNAKHGDYRDEVDESELRDVGVHNRDGRRLAG